MNSVSINSIELDLNSFICWRAIFSSMTRENAIKHFIKTRLFLTLTNINIGTDYRWLFDHFQKLFIRCNFSNEFLSPSHKWSFTLRIKWFDLCNSCHLNWCIFNLEICIIGLVKRRTITSKITFNSKIILNIDSNATIQKWMIHPDKKSDYACFRKKFLHFFKSFHIWYHKVLNMIEI